MSSILSEQDKLAILALASGLVLFTALLTVCLVLPMCPVHRHLLAHALKRRKKSGQTIALKCRRLPDHLRLSIVPVYRASTNITGTGKSASVDDDLTPQLSPRAKSFGGRNQFENLTSLAEKTRLRYCSLKPDAIKTLPSFPKVRFATFGYELINESSFQIRFELEGAIDLHMTEYSAEPSCYLSIILIGYKQPRNPSVRKSIIHKASQSEIFRTETVKRCLTPMFQKRQFTSEELPKCLLRDGCLKFRLIDEERNANDICLGELIVPLKKLNNFNESKAVDQFSAAKKSSSTRSSFSFKESFKAKKTAQDELSQSVQEPLSKSAESQQPTPNDSQRSESQTPTSNSTGKLIFTLFPIKESKGELFAGFCYLPTSRRINITVVKANLRSNVGNGSVVQHNGCIAQPNSGNVFQQSYYVRILMFQNGRLLRKKRSSASVKLLWGENETIGFDLTDDLASDLSSLSFMLVLSYRTQCVTSPSSPEEEEPELETEDSLIDLDGTPRSRRSSSKTNKDRHVGHFVLDRDCWIEEVVKRPRKQVLKWFRLF